MTVLEPIAHSENDQGEVQPLIVHLRSVASWASQFAEPFQSEAHAEWIGWWHDAGKVADDVQAYLKNPDERPSGPDHSSAGMLLAHEVFEPLAFNIAGHHGGLPDREALRERVQRKFREQRVLDAVNDAQRFLKDQAAQAIDTPLPDFLIRGDSAARQRKTEFWLRMLHSALVDADSLDTEAHFRSEAHRLRASSPSLSDLWDRFADDQSRMMEGAVGSINALRAEIYDHCLSASSASQGIFSLTVPTGGGKTRSAMAFALKHAMHHGLDRVIAALPYTSIIDQNAAVYRDIFGERAVLEHHSSVQRAETSGDESEEERWRRLAAENWDAPIVVTTTVQLFESLFANQNGRCRKLHNVANSVIVLDEVQTLPPHLLKPTLEVLQHLVDAYGVTVLLCTATQPALRSREGFAGLEEIQEISPDPQRAFRELDRVEFEIVTEETWTWENVATELGNCDQAMVVLNTIGDAMALLDQMGDQPHVYHLSSQLCAAHRRAVLTEVRERLANHQPVRLIATQVVEAGVDIDFPTVFRALGPLDRIIQAAGRCNREGKLDQGRVIVFEPAEGGLPPGTYKTGTDITRSLFAEDPELDLNDPSVPLRYFERLYESKNLDDRGIQGFREQFQFEETAKAYRLIDDDRVAVVVPYDEDDHRECGDRLLKRVAAKGWADRDDFRALQPYMVNLRRRFHQEAVDDSVCSEVAPGVWEWSGGYDSLRGLQWGSPHPEDLVV